VLDYQGRIHFPVEVALLKRDEVISLLATLGAAVEVPIKASFNNHTSRMSMLQWTSRAVAHLSSITISKQTHDFPTSPVGDTWSQYRTYLTALSSHREDRGSDWLQRLHRMRMATKDYYARAESILRAHGAALPEVLQTVGIGSPVAPQGSGYFRHTKGGTSLIPIHLKVFYDELYEACWTGDNVSIQELCLPKELEEGKEPIQISVKHNVSGAGMLMTSLEVESSDTSVAEWTPLLVALHHRHWETARLVLAIATAQYQPPVSKGLSFADTSKAILFGTSPTSLHL
jgi:hypothetical protein